MKISPREYIASTPAGTRVMGKLANAQEIIKAFIYQMKQVS
jgi:hypothetical protein